MVGKDPLSSEGINIIVG